MSVQAKERPPATGGRPPTFDHLAKKKPVEIREWIPLDDNAVSEFNEAKNELQAAELIGDDETGRVTRAKDAYTAAEKALKANSVEVIFRGIKRPVYEELKRAHPPTKEQVEEHKREYGVAAEYNAETFAPALISASCVQPQMTPEQVSSLVTEHDWNAGEFVHLFQLALRVNEGRRTVDLAF